MRSFILLAFLIGSIFSSCQQNIDKSEEELEHPDYDTSHYPKDKINPDGFDTDTIANVK